jgi:hypothetical protein
MSIYSFSLAPSLSSLRRTRRIVTDRSVDNTIPLMLSIRLLLLDVAPFWFVEHSTTHATRFLMKSGSTFEDGQEKMRSGRR